MNRSLLSLDFYGNGITAALACIDAETNTLRICQIWRKQSRGFSGALVRDLSLAEQDLKSLLEEIFEHVTESPSVIVGMRGSVLSFQRRSSYAAVAAKNRIIRQSDIDDTLQAAIPPNLDETLEVIDILPLSFSLDGSDDIADPLHMRGFMLGADTFMTFAQTSHLANLNKVLTDCHCGDYQVLASSVALGETLLIPSERKGSTLVMDIGENSTSILLYQQGKLAEGWEINKGFNILVQNAADLLCNDEDTARQILLDNPPGTDKYTDEIWEDCSTYLLTQLKEELLQSFLFVKHHPTQLVLSGFAANKLVLKTAKELLNMNKARVAILDDLIADCPTDNPAHNGALTLIEHALSREAGDVSISQVQEKGFFSGLFSKLGLNLF